MLFWFLYIQLLDKYVLLCMYGGLIAPRILLSVTEVIKVACLPLMTKLSIACFMQTLT